MPQLQTVMQVIQKSDKVAVIGDGKLGLLVAQALVVLKEVEHLTHFGRHQSKLQLVSGTKQIVVSENTKTEHSQVRRLRRADWYFWHGMASSAMQ